MFTHTAGKITSKCSHFMQIFLIFSVMRIIVGSLRRFIWIWENKCFEQKVIVRLKMLHKILRITNRRGKDLVRLRLCFINSWNHAEFSSVCRFTLQLLHTLLKSIVMTARCVDSRGDEFFLVTIIPRICPFGVNYLDLMGFLTNFIKDLKIISNHRISRFWNNILPSSYEKFDNQSNFNYRYKAKSDYIHNVLIRFCVINDLINFTLMKIFTDEI
jgi:hypothetical protein